MSGRTAAPEFTLEPADLLADRGLHDVQSFRRPPETQLVGDGDEIGQLPDLHAALAFITIGDRCTVQPRLGPGLFH
jgi:hypothetical protein